MDTHVTGEILAFGGWRFNVPARLLLREDASQASWWPVSVGSRALEILALLLDRPGALVSKDTLMGAVWPVSMVEPNNLTVQIAALRRVLDEGRTGKSCIQTIPGRGYRFVLAVAKVNEAATVEQRGDVGITEPVRLSLAVLPFKNVGADANEDYLADAITEDLTTNLSRIPGALVIARTSALFYTGQSTDVRHVGQELGVRYVVQGNTRRLRNILRVNVQLVSTETGAHLWADRFDQDIEDLCDGQEEIVNRLSAELGVQVIEAESTRSERERLHDPDAFDFFLRARSAFRNQSTQSIGLYERALELDPSSARIMILLARELINRYLNSGPDHGNLDLLDRAATLISAAATLEPNTEHVIFAQGFLLRAQARYAEAIALLQQLVERAPNNSNAFRQLGICMIGKGRADEAIPHLRRSIRLDPLTPNHRFTCHWIGQAMTMLCRDAEAVEWHQQALAATAKDTAQWRAQCYLFMASAYGLLGRPLDAQHALTEASRLWPYATARSFRPIHPGPYGLPDPAVLAPMHRIQYGLRLAGLRDHAEEAADFGLRESGELCADLTGPTPLSVLGASTIRTGGLEDLIAQRKPILIDVASTTWGRSIPGAIGLQGTGPGIQFSEARQTRFRLKIQDLTSGDLSAPIVVFGMNSEGFAGCNLALRLVALGYNRVYWYRGGLEAWQVNGLPEGYLELQDW
jgi:TolB-like protein